MGKEGDREAFSASAVVEPPYPVAVETDQRRRPARAVKIGPLIGKAQMNLDDPAADQRVLLITSWPKTADPYFIATRMNKFSSTK
jgi:hypothetical protein